MAGQGSSSLETIINDIITDRHIIRGIYYGVIMITGFMIISFLSRPFYDFGRSILFMSIWFLLIILLQPPEKAELQSEPFEDPAIID